MQPERAPLPSVTLFFSLHYLLRYIWVHFYRVSRLLFSPTGCFFLFLTTLHDLFKPPLWSDYYFWHESCLDCSLVCLPRFPLVLRSTRHSLPLPLYLTLWLVCRVCSVPLMHPLEISNMIRAVRRHQSRLWTPWQLKLHWRSRSSRAPLNTF